MDFFNRMPKDVQRAIDEAIFQGGLSIQPYDIDPREIEISATQHAEEKDKFGVSFRLAGRAEFYRFFLEHRLGGETKTTFITGCWSGCGPVPDDAIHGKELNITPARHRLEHDLWHHLVGIFVYKTLGSPIIWRDAHGIPQPKAGEGESVPYGKETDESDLVPWGPCEEEEWLVTALFHLYHDDHSRDHGASIWLLNNGHDVELMLQTAQQILDQIPSD